MHSLPPWLFLDPIYFSGLGGSSDLLLLLALFFLYYKEAHIPVKE